MPDMDHTNDAEIGYWQGAEFTGQGYMARAVEALTLYGFERSGCKTIYGKVFETNVPSMKVLRRAGYTETGKTDGYIRFTKSDKFT